MPMPTLHVQEICLSPTRNTCAPTLRMRLFAQVSTSRCVPRSISSTNVPSPKRPNRSLAWRVSAISPANWPMNSSIASGPTSSAMRVELVGLDRDELAHAGLDRLRQRLLQLLR